LDGNTGATVTSTTDSSTVTINQALPSATVEYSETGVTQNDVIATLTGASEPITVTNNGHSFSHTFTGNTSFTFEFVDATGFTGATTATVTNIDKAAPVISGTAVSNLTQTGASVLFSITDAHFTQENGHVIVYTGGNVSNFVETGALTFNFVSGSGTATALFSALA